MLKLIDIEENNLPNVGDLIFDPNDGAVGLVYDIKLKTHLVYWIHIVHDELYTQESQYSLMDLKLIAT